MDNSTKSMVRSNKPTTPEEFPAQSPPPSGDYSYTLEIVMNMQLALGKLIEAVDGLKADSKEYRNSLKTIEKEIHGARTSFRVLIGVFVAFAALIGWAITTYISATHK
jgi:hypothetical protein